MIEKSRVFYVKERVKVYQAIERTPKRYTIELSKSDYTPKT